MIFENLSKLLLTGKRVWVRIPVVSAVNDTVEEMTAIRRLLDLYGYPEKVELLPYHAMGEHKYAALGRRAEIFSAPSEDKIAQLRNLFF